MDAKLRAARPTPAAVEKRKAVVCHILSFHCIPIAFTTGTDG